MPNANKTRTATSKNKFADDELQWHDFINPAGMLSWAGNSAMKTIKNVTGAITGDNQKRNQELQREVAREQMEYQTNSAQKLWDQQEAYADKLFTKQKAETDTAYQRAVADMKEAGLNPILALGSPASSASGSMVHGTAFGGSQAQVDTTNQMLEVLKIMFGTINSAMKN